MAGSPDLIKGPSVLVLSPKAHWFWKLGNLNCFGPDLNLCGKMNRAWLIPSRVWKISQVEVGLGSPLRQGHVQALGPYLIIPRLYSGLGPTSWYPQKLDFVASSYDQLVICTNYNEFIRWKLLLVMRTMEHQNLVLHVLVSFYMCVFSQYAKHVFLVGLL